MYNSMVLRSTKIKFTSLGHGMKTDLLWLDQHHLASCENPCHHLCLLHGKIHEELEKAQVTYFLLVRCNINSSMKKLP